MEKVNELKMNLSQLKINLYEDRKKLGNILFQNEQFENVFGCFIDIVNIELPYILKFSKYLLAKAKENLEEKKEFSLQMKLLVCAIIRDYPLVDIRQHFAKMSEMLGFGDYISYEPQVPNTNACICTSIFSYIDFDDYVFDPSICLSRDSE